MKYLYFIRHGESKFNQAHKWAGSTDTPLTSKGHQQAQAAGKELQRQDIKVDVIISSPLERAHQTAKHVASAIDYPISEIIIQPNIIERHFGALEGRRDLVARTKYLLDESAIDHYENVEKLTDLQSRADEVLSYLQSLPAETIVIVSHGAFGRALRRSILKQPLSQRGESFENAQIIRLI